MTETAGVLDATVAFLRRYVVLSAEQADALALWTFHTWALEATDVTPYVHVSSPEKRSGKTRLLEVLALLVRAPLPSANISDAALFRAIEAKAPTLLFDEVDSIFGPKTRDREDLRGLLNAGHRRGTPALRMGGAKMTELQEFATFSAKVLAGIGKLPDTIADRSIPVRLKRRKAGEPVERFRHRDSQADAEPLRQALESLAAHHVPELAEARPRLPDELGDRAQDSWEPLLAIAELASDEWPARARSAAIVLSGDEEAVDDTLGVRLLADIQAAFSANGDRLSTAMLLDALKTDDEAPWADWHGNGLSAKRLADLLRPYGIKSRTIRLSDGSTPKGFRLEQFKDTFERYLSPVDTPSSRHSDTTRMSTGVAPILKTPQEANAAGEKQAAKPHGNSDVADVAGDDAADERRGRNDCAPEDVAERLLVRHADTAEGTATVSGVPRLSAKEREALKLEVDAAARRKLEEPEPVEPGFFDEDEPPYEVPLGDRRRGARWPEDAA